MDATARHENSGRPENEAEDGPDYIRALLISKYGPLAPAVIDSAAEVLVPLRYVQCPRCGGYRERAIRIPLGGCEPRNADF